MKEKPSRFEIIPANIPEEIIHLKNWVTWKWEFKNEKWTKPPYNPNSGELAKSTDPNTWVSFNEALEALHDGGDWDGLGFILTPPYCGIDWDDSVIPETGDLHSRVLSDLKKINSYTEYSPSGKGVKTLCRGILPKGGHHSNGVGVFQKDRYFCITGHSLPGVSQKIEDRQEEFNSFCKQRWPKDFEETGEAKPTTTRIDSSAEDWIKARNEISKHSRIMSHWLNPKPEDRSGHDWRLACLCVEEGIRNSGVLYQIMLHNPQGKAQSYPKTVQYIEDIISRCLGQFKDNNAKDKSLSIIDPAIIEAGQFVELPIPKKRKILNPWLSEQTINLISGWRGTGKTWLGLSTFDAITKGEPIGPWSTITPVSALYLDGEMASYDVQERVRQLNLSSEAIRKEPLYIYSDAYANSLGIPRANLLNAKWRNAIKNYLTQNGIKLFGIDNLSSLAPGSDENKKFDWDPINQWLLEMRFMGIATILFHHTGKEGTQRGTSAREDNVDCSIILQRPHDYLAEQGAKFIVKFKKARVPMKDLNLMGDVEFTLTEIEGQIQWKWGAVKRKNQIEVIRMLDEGIGQTDIANVLGIDKGYVSRIKAKAIRDKLLTEKGKLTDAGLKMVNSSGDEDEI